MKGGFVKTKELHEALNLPRKTMLDRAKREHWAFVRQGNNVLWVENRLPVDVRFALSAQIKAPAETLPAAYDARQDAYAAATDKQRKRAVWRSGVLFRLQQSSLNAADFAASYNRGEIDPVLLSKTGSLSAPTLYRWQKEFKTKGAAGIIPKYGMSRGGAGESLSDPERDLLRYFWLKPEQPSVPHALTLMKANVPYSTCTEQTARRYLKQIPIAIADYYRKGKSRFENAYLPYMEQDVNRYKSLDCVVSDHHVLDCVCMYKGKLVRPWITTMQDYRSGKILGWCVCVKPSSLSIIVAYYMAVIRYGVPRTLLFDNGQDYRSKLLNGKSSTVKVLTPEGLTEEQEVYFEGVFAMIGSDVHFTRVYNGKSKGRQERYFRVIGEYLAKDFGTYVGSDSRSRPEEAALMWRSINGLAKRNDIPDFKSFCDAAANMVQYINDSFICSGKGCEGKTRSQVFDECLPAEIRQASKEMLQAALVTGEVRKCGRNGVKIHGANFWHPDMIMVSGQDVIVRSSLVVDNEVQIFKNSGEYLCTATGNYFRETGDLGQDTLRLGTARNKSLALIAEQGLNEVAPPPEYESMIEVASSVYGGKTLPDIDEVLELPKAAGQSAPVFSTGAGSVPAKKSNLVDPFINTDDTKYL